MVYIGHILFFAHNECALKNWLRMLTMLLKVSLHAELAQKFFGACSVCAKNPKFIIFLKTQKTTESTNF